MSQQEHLDRLQKQAAASQDESVQAALSSGQGLRAFLQSVEKLSPEDLERVVDQAIAMLEGFYVHLPFKRAMHGIDPLRRLRLLRRRVRDISSEIAFHKEMTEIFTSLRDLHTRYVLPLHFARMVAFLPFRVEACYEAAGSTPHYIVARTATGFTHATFLPGVELRYYNGVPIDRAVEIAAEHHAGSNPSARRARGLAGLTKRAMNVAPPPDEEWAVIGYTTLDGREEEILLEWTISDLPPELESPATAADPEMALAVGLDLEGDTFRRVDRMLFAAETIKKSRERADLRARTKGQSYATQSHSEAAIEEAAVAAAVPDTESIMPLVFTARRMTISNRPVAYVRIHTFNVDDDTQFVNEFLRLINLAAMPNDGLIIDVRGNGGGLIWAGERLLQLLTPRTIEPCRAQFISTPQSVELCRAGTLRQWLPSLERSLGTGAPYSAAFPITPPERCNDIGQRYYGPVVLITDARSYSTTDIFAAGFRDHDIGKILGTDHNMGAGGANVWTLDQIRGFLGANPAVRPPLEALPRDAGMRVALRRTLRVGAEAGTEMEDLGVPPDEVHPITRNDVLHGDPDLFAKAVAMLDQVPPHERYRFDLAPTARVGSELSIALATSNVSYVDVYVDRRPRASHDVVADALAFQVAAAIGSTIDLRGYRGNGQLVCARRWSITA